MMVRLVYATPLMLIANAIRYSKGNQDKNKLITENISEKDINLIKRVAFGKNHSSVLEHSLIVYDIRLSTKALLELEKHRIGVSMTVTSTRFALDKMKLLAENTTNKTTNFVLGQIVDLIRNHLNGKTKKDFDDIAMLLPQAFIYTGQFSFNLRSLSHFFELRRSPSAHYSIRDIANAMYYLLPEDYKKLFEN